MQFPYGPLAPDAGNAAAGVTLVANGVLPKPQGFGPAQALVTADTATALPGDPRGMVTCLLRDGVTKVFGLTVDSLYELGSDFTWTLIDNGYTCTSGDDWSCQQFGNFLLYTNTTDGLWAYDIENGGSPAYLPQAGDPREIFICANMVFGLDCKDTAGTRDNRLIRNSDFNDHTDWSTGGADYQPLEAGGELLAGYNLRNGAAVILQRNSLRVLQFGNVGGGALYSLQEVSTERGVVGKKSCVVFDGVLYGISTNGFFRFTLQAGLEFIGAGMIDEWFLSRVALADLSSVQGAIDPARKIVLWRFPTDSDPSETVFTSQIGYSWGYPQNPWFTWSQPVAYLSRIATAGYTLEDLDAFGTVDSITISWDDRFWQGGQQVFAAIDADGKYATFSGAAQEATITTATSNSPISALISWATPIDDASAGVLELAVADQLADTLTWKAGVGKARNGAAPIRGRGLNIAFRRTIPEGSVWSFAKGIDHIRSSAQGPK